MSRSQKIGFDGKLQVLRMATELYKARLSALSDCHCNVKGVDETYIGLMNVLGKKVYEDEDIVRIIVRNLQAGNEHLINSIKEVA
jgi:hypothetical protein